MPPSRRPVASEAGQHRSPPKAMAAAIDYTRRGWSMIPLVAGAKRPAAPWRPYQHEIASTDQIADWFRRYPDGNLGIVTGTTSGLVVLDVDPRHGGDQALTALERHHGRLPRTAESITGGGGRHLYFRHPGGTVSNRVGLAPGIDLRGDGGFVVAPPSLHPSGRRYRWRRGRRPDDAVPAEMPAWLLKLATGRVERAGHPVAYWRALLRAGVRQGQRNDTIASLAGHLLWHQVDPAVVTELLLCWNAARCRPPLPDDELVRTVANITRLHRDRQMAPRARPEPDSAGKFSDY